MHRPPWIEALVFLSAPEDELQVDLRDDGKVRVVTRSTFARALTHHDFFGADPNRRPPRISAPEMRDIVQAVAAVGLQKRKGKSYVGQYELGDVLMEGSGFQDRAAKHRTHDDMRRRARVYLVPQQTSVERRQQLSRAAAREAQLLYSLREHPNILSFVDHEVDAPLGPTVLFDEFEGGVPLPAFLRQEPNLGLEDRAAIVRQVGRALHFCHQKSVIHRALCPDAVLARRHPDTGAIDTRLFNFQLAEGDRASATLHWSALASDPWALYQPPELREDVTRGGKLTEIFSLGALAYFVLTGKEPAASLRELDERLLRDGCLDPSAVVDHLPDRVADLVREATARTPALRFDDLFTWIEVLDAESRPVRPIEAKEVDPLEARDEDMLGGDLLVEKVLGHGATSRVLQVTREKDNASYALKVSLGEEHDERLRDEAEALAKLRHHRIVELLERRTIGGRTCLVLSLAGRETLQSYLAREGPVSLDYAARFGEDLLFALEYLQDEGVVHRDIKPANVGIGSTSKKDMRLTLFDFSLVRAAPTDLQVGTSAYRDPFLSQRGAWDAAADRYSAAITLHEMVTGLRASLPEGKSPLDADAEVVVAAERFDPSVREALSAFFAKALARDVERRFESARAMRVAWERAFRADSAHPAPPSQIALPPESRTEVAPRSGGDERSTDGAHAWDDAKLRAIELDTPVERLPLGTRARNALDRMGVVRAREILDLPENQISAVRGVGTRVSKEVLEFRSAWVRAASLETGPAEPFFTGYRGDDVLVTTLGLEGSSLPIALDDAGLRTLRAIASAPKSLVEHLAERAGVDVAGLRAILERESAAGPGARSDRALPPTLEAWVDELLEPEKKRSKYLLSFYGLAEPFLGRLDVSATEVAEHHGVTRANLYLALGDLRSTWQKHAAIAELRALVLGIVEAAGGASSLEKTAKDLAARLPSELASPLAADRPGHDALPGALTIARAAALVRIVTEVDKERADGVVFARLYDRGWIVLSEAHAAGLRRLGDACDALAERAVLASWGEAARVLEEAAKETPFASLPADVLARLGTDASPRAACSARQEIYPANMEAERALELSAPLLRGRLTPEAIAKRVAARYPEAEPVPMRPKLDTLLERHGLVWDGTVYYRPGERPALTSVTTLSSLGSAIDEQAADFDERLRKAAQGGGLRVVGVSVRRSESAALALAKQLGVQPIDLSAALLAEMRAIQAEEGITNEAVHGADREGERAPETWSYLRKLAHDASERLAKRLLPPKAPLVLAQPGLFARYRLDAFSESLRSASSEAEAAAIFLVVPARDGGRVPHLDGWSVTGAKTMWMPETWVAAATRAPA